MSKLTSLSLLFRLANCSLTWSETQAFKKGEWFLLQLTALVNVLYCDFAMPRKDIFSKIMSAQSSLHEIKAFLHMLKPFMPQYSIFLSVLSLKSLNNVYSLILSSTNRGWTLSFLPRHFQIIKSWALSMYRASQLAFQFFSLILATEKKSIALYMRLIKLYVFFSCAYSAKMTVSIEKSITTR